METIADSEEQNVWMPDYSQREMGQFNIFPINSLSGDFVDCQPFNRKGFYKISLLRGHTRLYYADKDLEYKNSALLFSNPYVPYSWKNLGEEQTGYYCVFTEAFIDENLHIKDYQVFKPGSHALYELNEQQDAEVNSIFLRMEEEMNSDFEYKYDVLRNLTLELVYKALKMHPVASHSYPESNGASRVATLFSELLERQFPIESPRQRILLRFPAEYAENLSIHINYLNRSLKRVTGRTTSQLIAARMIQEARILLQHTDWNITEIGWCLGFEELPHFINFFKKNQELTPKQYRNIQVEKRVS